MKDKKAAKMRILQDLIQFMRRKETDDWKGMFSDKEEKEDEMDDNNEGGEGVLIVVEEADKKKRKG